MPKPSTSTALPPWTEDDAREAAREGWALEDCGIGYVIGATKLALDEGRFLTDAQARDHVMLCASAGSRLHTLAMGYHAEAR